MPPFLFNQNYEIMRKFKCDYHYVDDLIRRYEEEGGQVICLNDGCLASGEWLLVDEMNKMKCFYTYELALNGWSCCQVVHVYSCWDKLPKKYKKMVENYALYA